MTPRSSGQAIGAIEPGIRTNRWPRGLALTGILAGIVSAVMMGAVSMIEREGNPRADEWDVTFIDAYTNDDGVVNAPDHDPRDDGLDPAYDKQVASCTASPQQDTVRVTVANGYPSYTCLFWVVIQNTGLQPVRRGSVIIHAPHELTIEELDPVACLTLQPGENETESFLVHLEQQALNAATYEFIIEKPFVAQTTGTIGFWKNWERHAAFSSEQIESWLGQVDATSEWLGPTTVEDMEEMLDTGSVGRPSMESRFLAQYLATRLNAAAAILCMHEGHDVSTLDPGNYLGLSDPRHASLVEICEAIESKRGTSPSDAEYEIMKDLADALNNLDV